MHDSVTIYRKLGGIGRAGGTAYAYRSSLSTRHKREGTSSVTRSRDAQKRRCSAVHRRLAPTRGPHSPVVVLGRRDGADECETAGTSVTMTNAGKTCHVLVGSDPTSPPTRPL